MTQLSYGIAGPEDLLEKLILEGSRLTPEPNPYDVFNFIVTAAVLYEWVRKCHSGSHTIQALVRAMSQNDYEEFPTEATAWLSDTTCLPNRGCDVRSHILNALSICWDTTNASKHFHWSSSSGVTAIEHVPQVKDWYQYFFTSTEPDLYIEYSGEYYSLSQLKEILVQFYTGLLNHLLGYNTLPAPPDP